MNVPKLRFKEFSGEWEQTYLKDVITRINRVSDDFAPSMMITADSGFVLQSEKYSKDKAFWENKFSESSDILFVYIFHMF